MKPIGLRCKHDGELMIVHQCLSCGKIVNNRIAGDDIPDVILTLIQKQSGNKNILSDEYTQNIHDALYGKK